MQQKHKLIVSGDVKRFAGAGGWTYVEVPDDVAGSFVSRAGSWGMVPVNVMLGNSKWSTKLMKSSGRYFLALPKKVRRQEEIELGDEVTITLM